MQRKILLLLALPLLMTACGGSSKSVSSSGAISGNWEMSLQKSDSTLAPKTQSGFLLQNGNIVTGGVIFTDIPCSGVGSVAGTINGTAISLVVDPTGTSVNLSGIIGAGQTSMSGDYTILSTGCGGSQTAPQQGTWTANLVAPLSGNIQGSFSSNVHSTTYTMTGQVTQGANTGVSSAPLTGTLTATGYCFTTANIVGSISGTAVVFNLVDPDGTQIGQVAGTTTLDGTSMTGTYQVLGLGTGAAPGCVDGDSGTVTLTL